MNEGRNRDIVLAVSVILPNYNHAQYLEGTICSFLEQSHPPAEVVVVDDASTDESWSIITRLAGEHPTIIPVRREQNGGVNIALGDGLARATSPFVILSAADDVYLTDLLKHSVEMLSKHPEAALIFSDPAELIEATGEVCAYPNFVGPEPAYYPPGTFAAMLRARSFTLSSNTVLFRRELLTGIGGFEPRHHWHADWLAIMRLGLGHGVCYLPEVLSHFRVRESSYSHVNLRRKEGQVEAIAECLTTIYDSGEEELIARFRYAALMPQHNILLHLRLMTHPAFRKHVSPALISWVAARHFWSLLRPMVPIHWRKALRRFLNRGYPNLYLIPAAIMFDSYGRIFSYRLM